jgi:hypothetical protein
MKLKAFAAKYASAFLSVCALILVVTNKWTFGDKEIPAALKK